MTYARARAEAVGLKGEVGIAPRPERLVVLTVGLIGAGIGGVGAVAAGSVLPTTAGAIWLSLALLIIVRDLHGHHRPAHPLRTSTGGASR